MYRKLRTYLLLACLWAVCGTFSAAAQNVADTATTDTAQSLVEGATPIQGEYVPDRPVVYNAARPGNAQWQKVVSDKAYTYRDKLEYSQKRQRPEQVPGWYKFLIRLAEYLSSPVGKFLLW